MGGPVWRFASPKRFSRCVDAFSRLARNGDLMVLWRICTSGVGVSRGARKNSRSPRTILPVDGFPRRVPRRLKELSRSPKNPPPNKGRIHMANCHGTLRDPHGAWGIVTRPGEILRSGTGSHDARRATVGWPVHNGPHVSAENFVPGRLAQENGVRWSVYIGLHVRPAMWTILCQAWCQKENGVHSSVQHGRTSVGQC